jgi:hypothetical protein
MVISSVVWFWCCVLLETKGSRRLFSAIKSSFLRNKGFAAKEWQLVREFDGYLESVEGREIVSFTSGGFYRMPYKTRGSPVYRKSMITKMYGVEE